ncbi:MAG TPA: OST-HTH/LOTUS domain-containing protein [Rhodocyclaceae bacterium]|nr:OST-HTH/LOTUS domain-containing protein [Rhodocyclaceae bacterium]
MAQRVDDVQARRLPGRVAARQQAGADRKQEALDLVLETIEALAAERAGEPIWGSMIKPAIKRRKPGFSESYYGFKTFGQLLEEARARKLIELQRDEKSSNYIVRVVAT